MPRSISELIRLRLDRVAIPTDEGGSQLFSGSNPGYMLDEVTRAALEEMSVQIGRLEEHLTHVEEHLHGAVAWYGSVGAPTTTTVIDQNVNRPYVAISGNNTWGPIMHIVGTEDQPVKPWKTHYAVHLIAISAVSNATPFLIRFIYGSPPVERACANLQCTETMSIASGVGSNIGAGPSEVDMPLIPVGQAVWARCWNATNLATIDFFVGLHGLPSVQVV